MHINHHESNHDASLRTHVRGEQGRREGEDITIDREDARGRRANVDAGLWPGRWSKAKHRINRAETEIEEKDGGAEEESNEAEDRRGALFGLLIVEKPAQTHSTHTRAHAHSREADSRK